MESERLPRKLAAILYGDVAEYSRATGEDEDGAHRLLSDYLDLFSSAVARHHGRVMHYAGDALLAMFEAAVDALRTADEVQRELSARNAHLPEQRRFQFRIGVNLGDVIEDRGDIYGNGVNVAARLAALAEPGGICVSESARIAIGQKLAIRYESIGDRSLKNIAERVRVYRAHEIRDAGQAGAATSAQLAPRARAKVVGYAVAALAVLAAALLMGWQYLAERSRESVAGSAGPTAAATAASTARAPAVKASVAVLPFVNLSTDPEQQYLGDGVAEELLYVLANIDGLRVPSQTSSFTFKGSRTDMRAVAAALNVDHVLEGSVRKSGNRVRITAQLIDAATDSHVWSANYERELLDIFAIQDEIAASVAAALSVELLGSGPRGSRTDNVEAHDAVLRGLHYLGTQQSESIFKAIDSFQRATELDPGYADAFAWLPTALFAAQVYGLMSAEDMAARARPAIDRALALDPSSSLAYLARGQLGFATGDLLGADTDLQRAIALNPNLAPAHGTRAYVLDMLNRPVEARAELDNALELDPLNGFSTISVGYLLLAAGNITEAAVYFRRALEIQPELPNGYASVGDVEIFSGRLDVGLLWYLKGLERDRGQPHMTAVVGYIYRSLGDVERAQLWLDRAAVLLQVGSLPRFFRDYSRLVVRREDPRALLEIVREVPAQQLLPLSARLFRKAVLGTGDRAGIEAFLRQNWPELFAGEPNVNVANVCAATDVAWFLIGERETRRAEQLLVRALAIYRDSTQRSMQPPEWAFAMTEVEALALQGRKADALDALRRAADGGWRMDWWQVETDPTLASIRSEPQFGAIIAEVKADLAAQLAHVRELERDGTIPLPEPL
jgi:TolB-like protein/class 3 adenylate cyclase